MRDATLCFLVRGDPPREILLGLKKAGFGAGKYGGFGGKVETGETVAAAAARELAEEVGVKVLAKDLQQVGYLTFWFPAKPAWSQVVHVFLSTTWQGTPRESGEMAPAWFTLDEIPFEHMWQDGPYWLPQVLAGKRVRASFTFRADNESVEALEMEIWDGSSRDLVASSSKTR
jgi:ADP-ribose pyrophosphatase YjhB (NUDIX family)